MLNHSDIINGLELHLTQLNFSEWSDLLSRHCLIEETSSLGVTYFLPEDLKAWINIYEQQNLNSNGSL